jgi:NagD protein
MMLSHEKGFRAWFLDHRDEVGAVVFDVDGVLIRGDALAGAVKTVELLRAEQVLLGVLSNDGSHSPDERCRSLAKRGLVFHPEEIVSSSHGLEEVVAARGLAGRTFFVAGKLGRPCYGQAAGLCITRDPDQLPACAGVILGEEEYDWETTLNRIVNFFRDIPDRLLIVPNPDIFFRTRSGAVRMAPGAVTILLRRVLAACGVSLEPIFLGKPHQPIFEHTHHVLERRAGRRLPRERVVIVGDSLASDIEGGNAFGYRTALVLTGVTDTAALARSNVQPDLVFETLAQP